jgi:hypothetical protein
MLNDFPAYLQWMLRARFRKRDLPVALHFPLSLRMPPGAFPIDECIREQQITTEVHRRHWAQYGCLAHCPLPLLSYELPREMSAAYASEVRNALPSQALERIEWRIQAGLGVGVYYYPSVPIRVADLEFIELDTVLDGRDSHEFIDETLRRWAKQFARLVTLGYIPYGPWNQGWGACVDSGNACIDGGFADLLTLVRAEEIPSSRLYAQCLLSSTEALLLTSAELCARGLGRSLDVVQQSLVQSYVRSLVENAVRDECGSAEASQPYSARKCLEPSSLYDALDGTVDGIIEDEYRSARFPRAP